MRDQQVFYLDQQYIRVLTKKLSVILLIVVIRVFTYFSLETQVTENLDTHIYRLPFHKGTSHKVVQGYGGMFSLKNIAALDFEMPIGTAIYAARGGTVYDFKDNSDEGGPFTKYQKKANYIIIKHSDGSFGCYWHLKKDGVVIKKGKVGEGDLIAYSGNTGFVLRPHLHFAVKRKLNYEKDSFIKTRFRTDKGIHVLKKGITYKNQ